MKILTDLSESPLKVRKIAVYRFLISFLILVPKLLRFKDLKTTEKMVRILRGLVKIDKICDVM